MPKKIIVTCDGCGCEPDPNKNFLMVNGAVVKFTVNGPQRVILDQYFCYECADKILQTIEKLHDPKGANPMVANNG